MSRLHSPPPVGGEREPAGWHPTRPTSFSTITTREKNSYVDFLIHAGHARHTPSLLSPSTRHHPTPPSQLQHSSRRSPSPLTRRTLSGRSRSSCPTRLVDREVLFSLFSMPGGLDLIAILIIFIETLRIRPRRRRGRCEASSHGLCADARATSM